MIQSFSKYKQFKSLVDVKENDMAVRQGLDFLRFVAEEYSRLEVYNYQDFDGDDFFTNDVEKMLAEVLRDENTSLESVGIARNELQMIEKMEAYDNYCLCFFDHVHEAIKYRLDDTESYLEELDKQINHHSWKYKRDIEDKSFSFMSSLSRYEELGKLLVKKIEYLRKHHRQEDAEIVMKEYEYVPSICSFKIDELLQQGLEDEALKEIDKSIAVYGDDSYNTTARWHEQKISILEKRHDKSGVIEEYRRLFRQFLNEKRPCYEKLKSLVPTDVWNDFAMKLFDDIPHVTDKDCVEICDLIVEEKKYQCLLKVLMSNVMSFSRVDLFFKYAPYMSKEDQATYVNHVIEELRLRLKTAKSKSYGYIVDDIKGFYTCGDVAQKLMSDFVSEIAYNYGNRPALMRLLRN